MKKLVVITGASSGIGAAIAKKMSQLGHPVLLLARRVEKMAEMNLVNAMARKLDVTDKKTFQKHIAEAVAKYGPVDLMVNNAGIARFANLAEADSMEIQRMVDVNIIGMINGIQAVYPSMKKAQSGTIINIGSVAGDFAFKGSGGYGATKFAVKGLTETFRKEVLNDMIRVSNISPGAVESEVMGTGIKVAEMIAERKKNDLIIPADAVANAVVYIYSQPQIVVIRKIIIAPIKQEF